MTNPRRRAFALPLVIAVIIIATILVTAVLTRHTGQSLLTQRHIDRYAEHHAFKGLEEAVSAWITGNGSGPVRDAIDTDGHAFDIELNGGQLLKVYFEDAQGSVLSRFSGLSDQDLDDAASTVEGLRQTAHSRAPDFIRKEGPLAVSVPSAPREVLHAVCLAVLSATDADSLLSQLLAVQASGDLTPESLNGAFESANIQPEDRARLARLLTTEPVLYRVWVEAWSPHALQPDVTYKGLCLTGGGRGAGRTPTTVTRNSAFLTWERVTTDPAPRQTPP